MTNSTDLWMMFKKSITAILDGPTIGASIFKYPLNDELVGGYRYSQGNT